MRVIHSPENKQLLEAFQAVEFAADDQPAIQLPQSRNMAEAFNRKGDEFEVDFDDTRQFAVWRWNDITNLVMDALSPADRHTVAEPRGATEIAIEIRKKLTDFKAPTVIRKSAGQLQPLPRTVTALIDNFSEAVDPTAIEFNVLWGLLYLNITLSYASENKLKRTTTWLSRLRRVVELFNRCLEVSEEINEARLAIVDVFDHMMSILKDSLKHLRLCSTDSEASRAWPQLDMTINGHLSELDASVKHLNDINSLSKVNLERQIKDMALRHAAVPEPEEHATFPLQMIPNQQNDKFFGREQELKKLNDALDWRGNPALRTYTIYGRRGVGKTQIAVEYAWSNPANFEAIFWIQCETSLSLRQSFTEMAVALQLPGADRHGHHEENLIAVKKWLKLTPRRWLMVFDNAERESILKQYWPLGSNGAILITSRKYYNFMKDGRRRGDTVKPFNETQSWDLLMRLLGGNWKKFDSQGQIKGSEEAAAKQFLAKLQGLALAIQQAAILINNPNIGGSTIVSTFELFKENERSLPPRQSGDRSEIVHSLDTLWDMIFKNLSRNARDILSVVSFFSPDTMLIDLFLPRKQAALDGKLQFCKQNPLDRKTHTALSSIVNAPPALLDALSELVRSSLISQDGRVLSVHRVVQEAMNFHSLHDLQTSFDSAVQLVHEAFPKQVHGDPMFKDWAICQAYIPHGAHLSLRFSAYTSPPVQSSLKGSDIFVDLLANCAWYLYEIGDYDTCLRIINTASTACRDKDSLPYAHLCNTAASCYYELNRVLECRQNWEITRKIREDKLSANDIELSIIYHNLGNLETAAEQYELAMAHFNHAKEIRLRIGEQDSPDADSAASHLAMTYLCIGRVYYLRQEWEEATKYLDMSEALYLRTLGAGNLFMSHVHYAYGNIEYGKGRWKRAKQSYGEALKISLAESPVHPITACAYYRLGCVEFKLRHHEVAKGFLDKAMTIAELRSPTRDDGLIARILWKTAQVLDDDVDNSFRAEATQMRNRAAVAKRSLTGRGEGDLVLVLDEDGNADIDEEEASYDALVPGYFR